MGEVFKLSLDPFLKELSKSTAPVVDTLYQNRILGEPMNMGKTQPHKSLTFTLLSKGYTYGHRCFGMFYKIRKETSSDLTVKYVIDEPPKSHKIVKFLICFFLYFHLFIQTILGTSVGDQYFLVSLIRKTMVTFTIVYIAVSLFSFHHKKHLFLEILKQGDNLESQFSQLGIPIPYTATFVSKFGRIFTTGFFVFCFIHRFLNALKYDHKVSWYDQPAQGILRIISLNFCLFSFDGIKEGYSGLYKGLGVAGVVLETIAYHNYYFNELFHLFFSCIMWQIFRTVRRALEKGYPLETVMRLHFQAANMMETVNDLLSSITFFSSVFTLFYTGYWLNYTILEKTLRLHHFAFFVFITKNSVSYLVNAHIHNMAHGMSSWLVRRCAEGKSEVVLNSRFALFLAQLYGRQDIGFKGLFFFTISPSFVTKIVGLILTYTVVVNQFYLNNNSNNFSCGG
ncbi:unnamed protein product [Orchesella dallaii]|uniref:Gustatory receptor n=1 Tax=Orchesella dallaii TaxID=48710 RepID=A0ABP1RGF1_9HEXA